MKTLVVYYSLEGSTRRIADQIANELSADLLEIKPVREFPKTSGWKFVVGGFSSSMNRPCPLRKLDKDPADYEMLIVGTPVWAFRPAPPVVTFLNDLNQTGKTIGLFCTHQGSPGATLKNMTAYVANNPIIATLEINTGKNESGNIPGTVRNWVLSILAATNQSHTQYSEETEDSDR